ncbi:MAG: FLAP-like endonuclease XPG [Gaeavirus sp.]|uniref:FLAP-like endonuclease XPG n=1 Tax=Gaeavirus sp. TaxID=2487767 RepID=A0A3G4ZYQ6_9VIRU|nr:MAG: FLAP-like endonuclease XPG [Gaeavirus sp.]
MGIEGLYKFINKNCPHVYQNVSIHDIKNKSCIIDSLQLLFSQLIYMRSKNKEVISHNGKNISHIHGLINSLTYYLKHGITPIFIFDGKSPDIKKKKIEERRQILRQNLKKLKELELSKSDITDAIKSIQEHDILAGTKDLSSLLSDVPPDEIIIGTPPELFLIDEELKKMHNIQEEYAKIYKKSIVLKDYFIADWIEILEFLGIPVLKAKGEADPLCAHILKYNPDVYGVISDDSDMLIFGAPRLMRKSINQQFTIIELDNLIDSINSLLLTDMYYVIENITGALFTQDNLIDFAILLGTDYAIFDLQRTFADPYDLLKYYMINGICKLITPDDMEKYMTIKNYYTNFILEDIEQKFNIHAKPEWKKPKLMELKKRLLELFVDEDYIDKNNEIFDHYYTRQFKRNISRSLTQKSGKIFDYDYTTHGVMRSDYPRSNPHYIPDYRRSKIRASPGFASYGNIDSSVMQKSFHYPYPYPYPRPCPDYERFTRPDEFYDPISMSTPRRCLKPGTPPYETRDFGSNTLALARKQSLSDNDSPATGYKPKYKNRCNSESDAPE